MPAYRSEAMILEAVESVLAQTEPRFELVVVDDGSPVPVRETLAGIDDPRVRIVRWLAFTARHPLTPGPRRQVHTRLPREARALLTSVALTAFRAVLRVRAHRRKPSRLRCQNAISPAGEAATTLRQPAGPSRGSSTTDAPRSRARRVAASTSATST